MQKYFTPTEMSILGKPMIIGAMEGGSSSLQKLNMLESLAEKIYMATVFFMIVKVKWSLRENGREELDLITELLYFNFFFLL